MNLSLPSATRIVKVSRTVWWALFLSLPLDLVASGREMPLLGAAVACAALALLLPQPARLLSLAHTLRKMSLERPKVRRVLLGILALALIAEGAQFLAVNAYALPVLIFIGISAYRAISGAAREAGQRYKILKGNEAARIQALHLQLFMVMLVEMSAARATSLLGALSSASPTFAAAFVVVGAILMATHYPLKSQIIGHCKSCGNEISIARQYFGSCPLCGRRAQWN
jgi:hypothetical protein